MAQNSFFARKFTCFGGVMNSFIVFLLVQNRLQKYRIAANLPNYWDKLRLFVMNGGLLLSFTCLPFLSIVKHFRTTSV